MSDLVDTALPSAKAKKKRLAGTMKNLTNGVQEGQKLLSEEPATKELSMIITKLSETLTTAENQFDTFATLVYEFVSTKKADKEAKEKEEIHLDDVTDQITYGNQLLAELRAKAELLSLTQGKQTSDSIGTPNPKPVSVQMDTTGIERSISDLLTAHQDTQLQTQAILTQLAAGGQNTRSTQSRSQHQSVNLPKLELETFTGDILKFQSFWDIFEATVHNNRDLTDVEKFAYLRTKVRGFAAESISGFALTNANYTVAVQLLKERYGKGPEITNTRYLAMVESTTPRNNTRSLREFYNSMETHLRSLQAAGENVDQALLIPVITSKLPKAVLTQLELSKTAPWSVKSLRESLNAHITARETAERMSGEYSRDEHQTSKPNPEHKSPDYTDHALVANASGGKEIKPPRCWFCHDQHFTDECQRYPTLDSRKEKVKDRCYACLREGHNALNCPDPWKCFHCGRNTHHRSLCPIKFKPHPSLNAKETPHMSNHETVGTCNVQNESKVHPPPSNTVLMQTARVRIQNGHESCNARILFDTGSSRTFIHKDVAAAMKCIPVAHDVLSIARFGAQSRFTKSLPRVEINVRLRNGTLQRISANVSEHISCPMQRIPIDTARYPGLDKFSLAEPLATETSQVPIDILVGNDHYFDFVGLDHIQFSDGLVLLNTKLGFIPSGKVEQQNEAITANAMLINTQHVGHINQEDFDLQKFWKLEEIGIAAENEKSNDDIAYDLFDKSVQFLNGRYYVSWPWKPDQQEHLPENFELANGRLKSLVKRLSKTPEVMEKYHDTILQQLKMGVIEEVTETTEESGVKHYIPHHCVVKPTSTTTKVRIVYDASAKTKEENPSLNDCMYRGPVLLPDLCGMLIRFRLNPIAITSDIEKAFLQVGLHLDNRDVTRFLWLRNPTKPLTKENQVTYRFCRIPFGVVASPFLLSATINHHLQTEATPLSEAVKTNTYVDNVLGGAHSEDDAMEFYHKVKQAFTNASMNLREWSTNSDVVNQQIPEGDLSNANPVKVLGMEWNTTRDEIGMVPNNAELKDIHTKRQMLSVLATFYDPLGYYSPILVRAKNLLQEVWKLKCNWDEILPESILVKWWNIAEDMSEVSRNRIPRYAMPANALNAKYELHVFCDASKVAYGAVAYLRTVAKSTSTHLVFAKSRIAPVKEVTIPRLELLAATIGARIVKFLHMQIPIALSQTYLWSDSQCVLGWVKGDKTNLPTFVANRVTEITTNVSLQFGYVQSKCNPADLLSRGASAKSILENQLWWTGPQWLQTPGEWVPETECDAEVVQLNLVGEGPTGSPADINPDQYSSFSKLVRVTAWVQKFIKCVRKEHHASLSTHLTVDEISEAELCWIKYTQSMFHASELKVLSGEEKSNGDLVQKLGLIVDDNGIIRCKGRMENVSLHENDVKCPILLSNKSTVARLVVFDYHRKLLHAGATHTLAESRKRFWITRGRETVKRHLKQCNTCKRYEGGPFKMPKLAPLPKERVTPSTPFSVTGLDYFGPITAKMDTGNEKVWVSLFTCLVTRAVHLEIVPDMTAHSFLMAFRRFVSRRGTPTQIISDNAKQFKLTDNGLQQLWNALSVNKDVQSYVCGKNIKWRFITELSPWKGGIYERIVQLVKRSLRKCLGRNVLKYVELETLLMEIEAVINTRPLTYVGDDCSAKVLTPAHFLCMNPCLGLPETNINVDPMDPDFVLSASSAEVLLQKLEFGQRQLNSFWKIWYNEYLTMLRERGDYKLRQRRILSNEDPAPGHVVLVHEDGQPRATWLLGVIEGVRMSGDEEIRSASVRLPSGRIINRPINLLYPVECQPSGNEQRQPPTRDGEPNIVPAVPATRAVRASAAAGRELIRSLVHDDRL